MRQDWEPGFKAGVLKLMLEHVDDLAGGDAVRQQLDPAIPRGIAAASRTDWVPALWGVTIYEVVDAVLGERSVYTLGAEMVAKAPSRPVFQPLLRGALHVFGRSPADLLRSFPVAQKFSTRHCGTCEVVVGEPSMVIFKNVPPLLRRRVWQVGQVGVLEAMLRMAGGAGTAEIDGAEFAETGAMRFIVRM